MEEIFINGQKLDLDGESKIELDFQACDVTKPDTVQASYSNVFTVPDTKKNQQISQFAGQVSAKTTIPYRRNDARLLSEGVDVLNVGNAILQEYYPGKSQNWQIFSGNKDLFEAIKDKSIRDLSFNQFDHSYTPENVVNSRRNTWQKGYIYDFINRKTILQQKFYWYDLYPSTFCRVIWDQIIKEAGFTYVWDRPTDNLFDKLVLPTVDVPKLDETYVEDRNAYVSAKGWEDNNSSFSSHDVVYTTRGARTIQFKNDDEDGYEQGAAGLFDTNQSKYTADGSYFVDLLVYVPFSRVTVDFGKITLWVHVLKNGEGVASEGRSFTGVTSKTNEIYEVRLKRFLMKPEDEIQVNIDIFRNTKTASYSVTITDTSAVYIDIKVRDDLPPDATVKLQNFLPDIKQADFIKSILFMFCGILETNGADKDIRFTEFNKLLERLPFAVDWSKKVQSDNLKKTYTFGEFGQRSWIRYLVKDEDNDLSKWDGYLTVDNENLDADVDIIELPYAATQTKLSLPWIKMFEPKDDQQSTTDENAEIDYDAKNATPRILVSGQINYELLSYLDNEGKVISVPDSWRPVSHFLPELDIGKYLIPNYWTAYQFLLDDTRFLTVTAKLNAVDVQNLRFSYPVYVKNDLIDGAYFYVNKISGWTSKEFCTVELIRL